MVGMQIIKIGVPAILPDNDIAYITYICRVIKKIDDGADVTIIKGLRGFAYKVIPSSPDIKGALVDEIILAHQALGVKIAFSKTLNLSIGIHFEIS